MNLQKRTLSPRWWQVTANSLPPHTNLITATEPTTILGLSVVLFYLTSLERKLII